MFTTLRSLAKHRVAALLLVATAGIALIQPTPALAQIWYPPPPSCHTDARVIQWRPGAYALYQYAYWYRGRRLNGPCPGGVGLYQRIYVYDVQTLIYPYGWVTTGRAEKVCGTVCAP